MLQLPLNVQLNDSARFDNFFSTNQLLLSRLKDLTNQSADFIYIWGATETGKTHLAQAVCHYFDENNLSAVYLPLSNNDFSPDLLLGMSCMDLVCLDDLNAVLGKPEWENALFDLYNNLKLENKVLVVFSASAPALAEIELADLKSRLTAMEIYKLETLNDAEKQAFFQQRAKSRGVEISNEVAKFLLTRKSRSVSDLMALLDQIDQSSIRLQRKVTIPLIKEIFNL